MLTTASQFTPRARSLQTQHAVAARVIGVSNAAGIRQPQQTRGFRFGMWFSHLDPELHHEIRRRHRVMKHRYAEQINRRLSWDKHPFAEDARHALKRMMKTYWISHDARPGGRYVDDAEADKQQTPNNKDGVRPGQNIEDVERGAIDHLLFGKDEERKACNRRSRSKQTARNNKAGSVPHSSYGSPEQEDSVIDPITNRRVAWHIAPNEPPWSSMNKNNKTVENDLSPKNPELYPNLNKYRRVKDKVFNQFEDLKPPNEDLDKYRSVVVDEISARFVGEGKAPYSDLDKYKPIIDETTSSKEDTQPQYDDLGKYNAFRHNEPDGKSPGHQVESEPRMDHREYASFIEGLQPGDFPPTTVEDLQKKYDPAELKKYTAVRHLEPDGNPGPSAEELSKIHDPEELGKYGPVKWNEPDGKKTPSEDPRVAEGLTKDYDPEELAKYGPVKWNEPDGNPTPSEDPRVAEGLTKDYNPEELAQYQKPVYWNEPDGQPLPSQDERVAEELTKEYNDLDKYSRGYRWNEPDGKPTPSTDPRVAEGLTKNYTDLDKYSRGYRWNEPDGKPGPTAEELSKHYTDLGDYNRAYRWNEPDGKPAPTAEELSKRYTDLDNYGPFKYLEPDGQPVTHTDPVQQGLEDSNAPGSSEGAEASRTSSQSHRADGAEKSNYRKMLDSLMKRHQAASDAVDREASLAVKMAKASAQHSEETEASGPAMTGNYVRDFPEEFEKSWPETISEAQAQAEVQVEDQHMDGGLEGAFGRPQPPRVQPALDRQPSGKSPITVKGHEVANADLNSEEPQDLNTSHEKEHYGNLSSPGESPRGAASREATSKSESTGEPTLYKILAYDPTMQEIKIADTSSYVPDTASALTPADALARLSNPSRFFPHFAHLEAEGYEIVSGTGDILVFRKVRSLPTEQAEETPAETQSASTVQGSEAFEAPVNPIDMTGRAKISPASANFASPTGYVNYENLPEEEASNLPPPPPRIKYNIDVQREEPVFSGSKSSDYDSQGKKKKSVGKRLVVGGVWVASISYALGVVSEYFTTGGVDGMGPRGL